MSEPIFGAFGEGEDELDEFAYNFDRWSATTRGKQQIPEPSTAQVTTFFEKWYLLNQRTRFTPEEAPLDADGKPVEETQEQADERYERNLSGSAALALKMADQRIELLSTVCSGSPSVEQITELPHRARRAFEAYVLRKLSPEG